MVHDVQNIVVGIDGSDASKQALRWAIDEARAHGAGVIAVHS
jgi:nucleotide-binding universal stress UspA family protein